MKTKQKKMKPQSGDGEAKLGGASGTYKYDAKLGRVMKVSDRIPSVALRSCGDGSEPSSDVGPCGRTECGGGKCAGASGDLD